MDTSRKKYDFVYNFTAAGKNITEVINVKEKVNQMFKDKLFLVMLVLGLLTMVAAAGIMTVQKGKNSANDPMLHMAEEEKYAYRGSAADGGRQ